MVYRISFLNGNTRKATATYESCDTDPRHTRRNRNAFKIWRTRKSGATYNLYTVRNDDTFKWKVIPCRHKSKCKISNSHDVWPKRSRCNSAITINDPTIYVTETVLLLDYFIAVFKRKLPNTQHTIRN